MDTSTDDEIWHVQLPSGDVCMMTLDLLDDAFQDGLIHERSLVWKEGSPGWMTLAEVAGLDDDASTSEATPPSTSYSQTPPPYSVGPLSTAPVAADIGDMDFDLDAISFRPRKRSPLRFIAAAAVIGAAAFGIAKRGALVGALHLPPTGSLANATGAIIAAPISPAPAPTPTVAPSPPVVPEAAPAQRLSDDTKRALEEADKKLAAKQQQKQKELQSRSVDRPRAKVKSENPFHKGGNKFDPLNASL
jgi:hypothetical protein